MKVLFFILVFLFVGVIFCFGQSQNERVVLGVLKEAGEPLVDATVVYRADNVGQFDTLYSDRHGVFGFGLTNPAAKMYEVQVTRANGVFFTAYCFFLDEIKEQITVQRIER